MREYGYEDVAEALVNKEYDKMNEASLWRVYTHYKKSTEGEGSFAILTSWRHETAAKGTQEWQRQREENKKKFKELQKLLNKKGYGFIKIDGMWRECQDPAIPYEKCPKDQIIDSPEPSLFVPNISFTDMVELVNKYEQDGAVYSGPETNGKVSLYERVSKKLVPIGEFHPNKIARAWSKLRGRSFVFEGFFERPQSFASAIILETVKMRGSSG